MTKVVLAERAGILPRDQEAGPTRRRTTTTSIATTTTRKEGKEEAEERWGIGRTRKYRFSSEGRRWDGPSAGIERAAIATTTTNTTDARRKKRTSRHTNNHHF